MILARIPWKEIGKAAEAALEGASVLMKWVKSKW